MHRTVCTVIRSRQNAFLLVVIIVLTPLICGRLLSMDEGTLKTSIPKCRLYWLFLFGVVKQFCRFWIWSETECKTPAEYGLQHNSTPCPPPPPPCLNNSLIHAAILRSRGQYRRSITFGNKLQYRCDGLQNVKGCIKDQDTPSSADPHCKAFKTKMSYTDKLMLRYTVILELSISYRCRCVSVYSIYSVLYFLYSRLYQGIKASCKKYSRY
jgi:hypothetical protein